LDTRIVAPFTTLIRCAAAGEPNVEPNSKRARKTLPSEASVDGTPPGGVTSPRGRSVMRVERAIVARRKGERSVIEQLLYR